MVADPAPPILLNKFFFFVRGEVSKGTIYSPEDEDFEPKNGGLWLFQ